MRPRSRIDHGTLSGDKIRWTFAVQVIGVDGMMTHELCVHIHVSNALSVTGAIGDLAIAEAILDNAKDAVASYHQRKGGLQVPGKDVTIGELAVRQVNVLGPIEERAYTIAVLDNAKSAIRDMHARRRLTLITENGSKVEI